MSLLKFLRHLRAARHAAKESAATELTAADMNAFLVFLAWAVLILVEAFNVAFPLSVAIIGSALTDFGDHLNPGLFSVLSAVMPLMLVAAVVEFGFIAARIIREEGSPPSFLGREFIRRAGRSYFAWFGIAEGAALYAVATRSTSTFLVLAVITPLFMFVQDIALTGPLKFSVEDLAWNKMAQRWRERLRKKADQFRVSGDIANAERMESYLGEAPATLTEASAALRAFD